MVTIGTIEITPPLINSSCAWASDMKHLRELYQSPHLGAITTRTATLDGFDQNETHTVRLTISDLTSLCPHNQITRLFSLIRRQRR